MQYHASKKQVFSDMLLSSPLNQYNVLYCSELDNVFSPNPIQLNHQEMRQ